MNEQIFFNELNEQMNRFASNLDNNRRSQASINTISLMINQIKDVNLKSKFTKEFDSIYIKLHSYRTYGNMRAREELLEQLGKLQKMCLNPNLRRGSSTSGTPTPPPKPTPDPIPPRPEPIPVEPTKDSENIIAFRNAYQAYMEFVLQFNAIKQDYDAKLIGQEVYDKYVEQVLKLYEDLKAKYAILTDLEKIKVTMPELPAFLRRSDDEIELKSLDEMIADYNKRLAKYKEDLAKLIALGEDYKNNKIAYTEYKNHYDYVYTQYESLTDEAKRLQGMINEQPSFEHEEIKYDMSVKEETRIEIEKFKKDLYSAKNAQTIGEQVAIYKKKYDEYNMMLQKYNEKVEEFKRRAELFKQGKMSYEDYMKSADTIIQDYKYLQAIRSKLVYSKSHHLKTYVNLLAYQKLIEQLKASGKMEQLIEISKSLQVKVNGQLVIDQQQNWEFENIESWSMDYSNIILSELQLVFKDEKIEKYKREMFKLEKVQSPEPYLVEEIDRGKEKPILETPEKPEKVQEREPEPVPPVPPVQDQPLSYLEVYKKVMGEALTELGANATSKYKLSNFNLKKNPFKKTDVEKRGGNVYALTGFTGKVAGLFCELGKSIGYAFVKKSKKELIAGIKERVNELTEEEVEIIIAGLKNEAQERRTADHKLFLEAVSPRIQAYYMKKIQEINNKIFNNIVNLNFYVKAIEKLEAGLALENEPAKISEIQETINKNYECALVCVNAIVDLRTTGRKMANGDGLHADSDLIKALKGKINDKGMALSKVKVEDKELLDQEIEYTKIMRNGTTAKEKVNAFMKYEQGLKENDKEKISLINLGSKVATGTRRYQPFVEVLHYGDDPLFRQIMSNIMLVTMATQAISNVLEAAAAKELGAEIAKFNGQITQNNSQIRQGKIITDQVISGNDARAQIVIQETDREIANALNMMERGNADLHNWSGWSSARRAADALHHEQTGLAATTAHNDFAALSVQYASDPLGFMKAAKQTFVDARAMVDGAVKTYGDVMVKYANANPDHVLTAITNCIDTVIANPASVSAVEQMIELSDTIVNGLNYHQLIELGTLSVPNLAAGTSTLGIVADALTTGTLAVGAATLGADKNKGVKTNYDEIEELKSDLEEEYKVDRLVEEPSYLVEQEIIKLQKELAKSQQYTADLEKKMAMLRAQANGLTLDEPATSGRTM